MILEKLSLPQGLNLRVLKSVVPEEELEFLIKIMSGKSRKERRIIFPSRRCLRKCLIYYLVEKYDGDFSQVMDVLRNEEGVLSEKGLHITNIKRLYAQRKKEIMKEN